MNSIKIDSQSQTETIDLGKKISKLLKRGHIVCLFGELGTGKTTFVKGMAKGLRVHESKVHSPTFILMNMYEGKLPLFHFDLYRLENTSEVQAIGCEEFFYDEGISVVEWAEKLGGLLPEEYLSVQLKHVAEDKRRIRISAVGKTYKEILKRLNGQ